MMKLHLKDIEDCTVEEIAFMYSRMVLTDLLIELEETINRIPISEVMHPKYEYLFDCESKIRNALFKQKEKL